MMSTTHVNLGLQCLDLEWTPPENFKYASNCIPTKSLSLMFFLLSFSSNLLALHICIILRFNFSLSRYKYLLSSNGDAECCSAAQWEG